MNFKIFSTNPLSHFIEVECRIGNIQSLSLDLQLPAWRPGRYELQNFAKNIQKFQVFDEKGMRKLNFRKITKDCWRVETAQVSEIVVKYNYYANLQNAGSSYVDENILYVNPVNLCIYAKGRLNEKCTLALQIVDNEQVAGGLPSLEKSKNGNFIAQFIDYYHLVDTPFWVSKKVRHDSFFLGKTQFHLWFEGDFQPNFEKIKHDFKRFSEAQIAVFGEFPEPDFHFMTWVLPIPFYHGVEHRNSTMMVLGPESQDFEELYTDLLGLASHELFHAWNICKIRPKELLPYDFTKENYFKTCFVAEGVTTYYGDLMLYRSGVFDEKQYHKELEACFKHHFEKAEKASQSLTESSWDLWLDGYSVGIPDRKVSVYHKGAIVAQILDLFIQKKTNNQRSLDDVMRLMWQKFGKPFIGYSLEDYRKVCEEVADCSLDWYFETCIFGNTSLLNLLNENLKMIDYQVVMNNEGYYFLETTDNKSFR